MIFFFPLRPVRLEKRLVFLHLRCPERGASSTSKQEQHRKDGYEL